MSMSQSSGSSSCGSPSPKYEFSDDSDIDQKRRGTSSRPRRLPTSNSKNAVAARINRIKQKRYVLDLEKKMYRLKRLIKEMHKEVKEREEKWASSRRQVAYLRGMIANSDQIGSVLRNIHWRNIIPQGSNVDKTLNELNSETSIDRLPITMNPSLFDGSFDLLEDRVDNNYHLMEEPLIAPQDDDNWLNCNREYKQTTTEVGVCLHISNRRVSIEFCDECSARFNDNPFAPQI